MLDFLVDENLPLSAVEILQDLGHHAWHVRGIDMQGARDAALFSRAQSEGWIIITRDLGFGSLLDYPLGTHAGIVVLRVPTTFTAGQINDILKAFVTAVEPDILEGALAVVEPDRYRIRRPESDRR